MYKITSAAQIVKCILLHAYSCTVADLSFKLQLIVILRADIIIYLIINKDKRDWKSLKS